ncbi:MAG: hypothetical protein ABIK62_02170 [candidate division WOR-3 bacterium]
MIRIWSLFIIAAGILVLLSCDTPPEAYRPEPNVHCIIYTDLPSPTVLAGMSVDMNDTTTNALKWNGVQGVTGFLRSSRCTTSLRPCRDSAGFYRAEDFSFSPGDECFLELRYPDGRIVSGGTQVPDSCPARVSGVDTVFVSYYPGDSWPTIRISIEHPHSASSPGFVIRANHFYQSSSDTMSTGEMSWRSGAESDTLYAAPFYFGRAPDDTLWLRTVTIRVVAVDRNVCDYYPTQPFAARKMHLEGALGLFGSGVVTSLRVTFP